MKVSIWFSPPDFLQTVLAREDKDEWVLEALTTHLTSSERGDLVRIGKKAGLRGWAERPEGTDGKPRLLVLDLVSSKGLPSTKWATELEFSEVGMDKVARWYPAFFLNRMLAALLQRLTISVQKDVRTQMLLLTAVATIQLTINILTWTIAQLGDRVVRCLLRKEEATLEERRATLTSDVSAAAHAQAARQSKPEAAVRSPRFVL